MAHWFAIPSLLTASSTLSSELAKMAGKKSKKKKKQDDDPNSKHVCTNRKARHEYDIVDELECGIALLGSEVKSIFRSKRPTGEFATESCGSSEPTSTSTRKPT